MPVVTPRSTAHITVGKLCNGRKQGRGVHGADVELSFVGHGLPGVLGHVRLIAGTHAGNAAGLVAVRLTVVQVTVVHHVHNGPHSLRAQTHKTMAQDRGDAQTTVHGVDIDPVAVGAGCVAVRLAPVAVAQRADAIHIGSDLTLAQIVDDAVGGSQGRVDVGDLLKDMLPVGVGVDRLQLRLFLCPGGDCTDHRDQHHQRKRLSLVQMLLTV